MNAQQAAKAVFEKALRQAQALRVRQIRIALGEINGLDPDQVREQWVELCKGTPLEHAGLQFRLIKAEVQCMACFKKYQPTDGKIHCPHCGSFGAKILSGEEFHVDSIETDE